MSVEGREAVVAGEDPMAAAERVLDLVEARVPHAEAEVFVRTGTDSLTRFANGAIHRNVSDEVRHVVLRVALDGRLARVSHDGPTDDQRLGRLVDLSVDVASVRQVDPD